MNAVDRFWSKVDKSTHPSGCWEWTASLNMYGYGQFGFRGTVVAAHRVAWELTYGPVPDGLCVCHRCDNRKCVNTAHLFVASQAANMRDMAVKGRGRTRPTRGADSTSAKLTAADVRAIRRRYRDGDSLRVLGQAFGVWHTTIADVVHRRTWTD